MTELSIFSAFRMLLNGALINYEIYKKEVQFR
jgi:hypothetical protein